MQCVGAELFLLLWFHFLDESANAFVGSVFYLQVDAKDGKAGPISLFSLIVSRGLSPPGPGAGVKQTREIPLRRMASFHPLKRISTHTEREKIKIYDDEKEANWESSSFFKRLSVSLNINHSLMRSLITSWMNSNSNNNNKVTLNRILWWAKSKDR